MADMVRRWRKRIKARKPHAPETTRRIARGRSAWGAKTDSINCFWGTKSRRGPRALDRCESKEKWQPAAWAPSGAVVAALCSVSLNTFGDGFASALVLSVLELTDYLDCPGNQIIQCTRLPRWRARGVSRIDRTLRCETYGLPARKKRNGSAAARVMPMRGVVIAGRSVGR